MRDELREDDWAGRGAGNGRRKGLAGLVVVVVCSGCTGSQELWSFIWLYPFNFILMPHGLALRVLKAQKGRAPSRYNMCSFLPFMSQCWRFTAGIASKRHKGTN